MIRVGPLTSFTALNVGKVAPFPSDAPRTVRLTFNAPQRTVINVLPMHPDGEFPDEPPLFLAVVEGLEDVEFYAEGAFALQADADTVWFRSQDGSEIHLEIPDAETFTRIAERRVRNPELERMQHMLMQNQERRMASVFKELADERRRLELEREALDSRASASGGDLPPAQPADSAGKPPSGAATPPSGAEGGKVDP